MEQCNAFKALVAYIFWRESDMIARKLISLLKSSACFSRISGPAAQLEEGNREHIYQRCICTWYRSFAALRMTEGNHEHTSQRCICTQPDQEEFRSIGSARHALMWAQTHPCASRMGSSGHPDRGALSCQAPGKLYIPSDHLHRRYVWCRATYP